MLRRFLSCRSRPILDSTDPIRSYSWKYFTFQRWKRKKICRIEFFSISSSKLSIRFIDLPPHKSNISKLIKATKILSINSFKECQTPLITHCLINHSSAKRDARNQLDSKSYNSQTFLSRPSKARTDIAHHHKFSNFSTCRIDKWSIDKIGDEKLRKR